MKASKSAPIIAKYVLWAALTVMFFFVLLTGRASLLAAVAGYAAKGFYQEMQVRLVDKIYIIIAGLFALVGIVVTQHYMANSYGWKSMLLRFALALGVLLIVLALFTFIKQIYQCDLFESVISTVTFLGPLLLGATLVTVTATMKS